MIYRLITTIEARLAHVNPHGIWVPITDGNFTCAMKLIGAGTIALKVDAWVPGHKDVYLVDGDMALIEDRFLSEIKGA